MEFKTSEKKKNFQCSSDNSSVALKKKTSRVGRSTTIDKAAQKVFAQFIRRKKQGTEKLFSKASDEEQQKWYLKTRIKDVIMKLTAFCKDSLEVPTVINETAEILKEVTRSQGVSSYLVDEALEYLTVNTKYMPNNGRHTVRYKIEVGATVAAYVAHTQEFVMVDDVLGDHRFPLGIPGAKKTIKSVLCFPVLTTVDGKCIAVIELFRELTRQAYTALDMQICISMTGWMGAAIHQNNERLFLLKKSELSNYLISLVEFYFMSALSFDKFVSDVNECAKLSVQAERASLLVLEEEVPEGYEDEIVGDIYVEGIDSMHYVFKKKNKQRFSKYSPGFAGHAARQGKIINVRDAYSDPRFNRSIDNHGFLTRSVISVPLKGGAGVVGVLQLINKVDQTVFTEKDEILLTDIAGYAYLACQHARVKEDNRKFNFRFTACRELLTIQMRPPPEDLKRLRQHPFLDKSDVPKEFFEFEWIILGEENLAPNYAVFMFLHLLGDYVNFNKITDFVLRVKKSYRENPYHNFSHAFTVTHCMFCILLRNKEKFTQKQMLCLMIATICHDSDHVGFTNNFLQVTNHWVADLYWESPLEHHHYKICKILLEGTDLLSTYSEVEYEEALLLLKKLILATDLAQFFKCRPQMVYLLKSKTFSWENREHQVMFMGVMMTMCDLSGQCKPFKTAKKILESLCMEFYNQGDIEKRLGLTPLSFMDREKSSTLPEVQIQFLNLVVISSVEILVTVLPNTEQLLKQCLATKKRWEDIRSKRLQKIWKIEEALAIREKAKRKKRKNSSSR